MSINDVGALFASSCTRRCSLGAVVLVYHIRVPGCFSLMNLFISRVVHSSLTYRVTRFCADLVSDRVSPDGLHYVVSAGNISVCAPWMVVSILGPQLSLLAHAVNIKEENNSYRYSDRSSVLSCRSV